MVSNSFNICIAKYSDFYTHRAYPSFPATFPYQLLFRILLQNRLKVFKVFICFPPFSFIRYYAREKEGERENIYILG